MQKTFSAEFIYQIFTLLIAVIIVQVIYTTIIWPNAEQAMSEMLARLRADPTYVPQRSLFIVLKDYEQQACFVLMFWTLMMMGYKVRNVSRERTLLSQQLLPIAEGMRILPEDTREYLRQIDALPEDQRIRLLPRTLSLALQRFGATRNVQDVSSATHTMMASEADRLDSELSTMRYVLWAIPCIGFIGTVRGISDALGMAYRAAEGDLTGVTDKLAVGFNSTLIALLINIFLMFLVHQLQESQEKLIFETEDYCEENLIRHLRAD